MERREQSIFVWTTKIFDRVDNIEDNELKNSIIRQVMICDEILTKIAESKFDEFYKEGYKEAKMDKFIYLRAY